LETPEYTQIIDKIESQNQSARVQVYPNPSAGPVQVQVETNRIEPVSVFVYDITGKLVRILADNLPVYGEHRIEWDGKTGSGSSLTKGVYFIRITTRDTVHSVKLIKNR
jgi:flagellar hook assembly protein FlgD